MAKHFRFLSAQELNPTPETVCSKLSPMPKRATRDRLGPDYSSGMVIDVRLRCPAHLYAQVQAYSEHRHTTVAATFRAGVQMLLDREATSPQVDR